MRNFLNKNHPKYEGLTKDNIHKLNCLHFMMETLKDRWDVDLSPDRWEYYKEACATLEYAMQKEWGFEQDSSFHTHIKYFE